MPCCELLQIAADHSEWLSLALSNLRRGEGFCRHFRAVEEDGKDFGVELRYCAFDTEQFCERYADRIWIAICAVLIWWMPAAELNLILTTSTRASEVFWLRSHYFR